MAGATNYENKSLYFYLPIILLNIFYFIIIVPLDLCYYAVGMLSAH